MNNPFKYGELAIGGAFCNRKSEIERLQRAFQDSQNIILISPRRWGKSSLVDESIKRFKTKSITVSIDCFGIRSEEDFTIKLMRELLKASSTKLQEMISNAKSYLKTISPFISFSTGIDNEITIGFTKSVGDLNLDEALDLPQKIAKSKKIPVIVCIDEFQMIAEWAAGGSFLRKLRSIWQKHNQVSYCLYGSKRSLMQSLFSNSSMPFYRFGETIFLEKIDLEDWVGFLIDHYREADKKISRREAIYLTEKVNGHAYFVQYLARIVWNLSKTRIYPETIDEGFNLLLNDHLNVFLKQTEGLTKYQVNYIKAFISGEAQFTSQRVLRDYDLGSPGNIKRIETSLYDSELIDYFSSIPVFFDPYFEPLFMDVFMKD